MQEWLHDTVWLGNSAASWLYALAGAMVVYLIARTALSVVLGRLRRIDAGAPGTATRAVRALRTTLESTRNWLLLAAALLLAASALGLGDRVRPWIENTLLAVIGLQLALWANALIALWLRPQSASGERANVVMLGIVRWGAQLIVWTTLLMALLANAGIDITAFVASLGIGGVAVALGLQTVLGDLFSSISIGMDKPFEVGEFIAFGDNLGTVRHVGVKSTRIDSLRGEQLVISNSNLLGMLVHNYSRMPHRRVVFDFRIPYGTPTEKIRTIVDEVRAMFDDEEQARFDRGHLASFGEFGLRFEFVYYVLAPDFTLYMDIQQRVNLKIIELMERLDVEFAVPARVLHMPAGSHALESLHRHAASAGDRSTAPAV